MKLERWLTGALVLACFAFCFYKLSYPDLQMWDEADNIGVLLESADAGHLPAAALGVPYSPASPLVRADAGAILTWTHAAFARHGDAASRSRSGRPHRRRSSRPCGLAAVAFLRRSVRTLLQAVHIFSHITSVGYSDPHDLSSSPPSPALPCVRMDGARLLLAAVSRRGPSGPGPGR